MLGISTFLNDYCIYPFMGIFVLYVIGRPKFLIKQISKLWGIKVTSYKLPLFFVISCIFLIGALVNLSNRLEKVEKLSKITESIPEHLHLTSDSIESAKRALFKCERGVFLYSFFFILTALFVKFSDVYEKKFELEEKLNL